MTDRDRPTTWSHDRIEAAFRELAHSRPTPRDLASTTIDHIHNTPVSARRGPRLSYFGGLVGAAAAILVAAVLISMPTSDRPGGQTLGLPVSTISDAIDVRDAGVDDRELIVAGYLAGSLPRTCPRDGAPPNPTYPRCGQPWLMERPESLITVEGTTTSGRSPVGPAISLSFALVDAPPGRPLPLRGDSTPSAVVLIGHFDDRRAVMCPADAIAACNDTFVVDRVESVEGSVMGPNVRIDLAQRNGNGNLVPTWSPDDVARQLRSVVPDLSILSWVAVPGQGIEELEPSLGTGALGLIDRPESIVWSLTGLDVADGRRPTLRTFLIVDGTAEAYESVPWQQGGIGFAPFTLIGPPLASEEPSPTAPPPSLTPPAGPASAPAEVLGLPVISVSEALARLKGEIDDMELAVRGYYVPPWTVISCTEAPVDANPLGQSCSTGSEWLMDAPEQLEDPTSGVRRAPTSPALNPVILGDVPFPLGLPGFEPARSPLPVVVLGHFADRRSHDFDAAQRFVVDSMVWRNGKSLNPGGAVEAISQVETSANVTERIERDLGPASAIWLSLVTPDELAATDPDAARGIPDLKTATAVWLARRIVDIDGRAVLRTAFTVEGSDRVWTDQDGGFLLATTIDVELGSGVVLQVVDNAGEIRGVRPGELAGAASWMSRDGPSEVGQIQLGVISEHPNELRVAWLGLDCDRTWQLDWSDGNSLSLWPSRRLPSCRSGETRREIVLTFDRPVVLEAIVVSDGTAGG